MFQVAGAPYTKFLLIRVKIATCHTSKSFLTLVEVYICHTVESFHVTRVPVYKISFAACSNSPGSCHTEHYMKCVQLWHVAHCKNSFVRRVHFSTLHTVQIFWHVSILTSITVYKMFLHVSSRSRVALYNVCFRNRCRFWPGYGCIIFTPLLMNTCGTVGSLLWFVSAYGCVLFEKCFHSALVPNWFGFALVQCTIRTSNFIWGQVLKTPSNECVQSMVYEIPIHSLWTHTIAKIACAVQYMTYTVRALILTVRRVSLGCSKRAPPMTRVL